jgi:putative ABC transport system substrate-binding protein
MPVRETNRRAFIVALGGAAAWPLVAHGQQPMKPIVGILTSSKLIGSFPWPFLEGLKEAGFVDEA